MSNNERKYVTVLLEVEVEDELALREAGFRAYRQGTSDPQAPDEESQSTVELALMLLLKVDVAPELPGARVTGVSLRDVGDTDPRLPPGVQWPR